MIFNKKIPVAVVLVTSFFVPMQAAPLSIDEAVSIAISNNITLKRQQISVDATKRTKNHSWNSISPFLTVSAGATKPNDQDSYDYSTYIKGAVSFSFSPALFYTIKNARLKYEQGLISFDEAKHTIELQVRSSYYGLLYEQENLALQKRNLQTALQQYQNNKAKYNAGRMSELDVLTSQVTYEKLKPTVQSAEMTLQNDFATFKQLLNLDQDTDITLSGSLASILDYGEIAIPDSKIDTLVMSSNTIIALQKQIESAKASVASARINAYGPSVNAGWTYQPTTTHKDPKTTTAENGSLSVSVSIPLDGILPWSSGADKVAAAKDTVADLELQLENQKTSSKVAIQNYLRKIQQVQSTIQSLQANIRLAQQSYEMTLDAYNHGTKDLLSLQTASDSLLEAQVRLKSEAYTLISAILNLENTLSVPFGTYLQTISHN
ncbi:MAG: TolC family protein [Treponema sp.]|nr:TolC family protein [Treponema sp.]